MTTDVFREFFYNERLDFKNLESDTIVVFDTNTLLNIYRYSNDTRNKLISAIKNINSNIWMPYQVGLEFNLNRRNVISKLNREKEKIKDDIEIAINNSVDPLKNFVRSVSLKSTDANSRKNEIIEFVEVQTTDLMNELQGKIDELYEMVDLSEDLASEIAIIFEGHIGESYTQDQLDTKLIDAKERYDNKIPPGYKDASKDDEVTIYNNIKFEKQYGDLIVWHQILDKASSDDSIKKVVLITDDNKEDWWYKSFGETIGPRAELKNEMIRVGKADFYMLNANSFLNNIASNGDVKDLISTDNYVESKIELGNSNSLWQSVETFKKNRKVNLDWGTVEKNTYYRPYYSHSKKEKDYSLDNNYSRLADINKQIKDLRARKDEVNDEIKELSNNMIFMPEKHQREIDEIYIRRLLNEESNIKHKIELLDEKLDSVLEEMSEIKSNN